LDNGVRDEWVGQWGVGVGMGGVTFGSLQHSCQGVRALHYLTTATKIKEKNNKTFSLPLYLKNTTRITRNTQLM